MVRYVLNNVMYIFLVAICIVLLIIFFNKIRALKQIAKDFQDKLRGASEKIGELQDELNEVNEKFSPIIKIDDEVAKKNVELSEIVSQINIKKDEYVEKRDIYLKLLHQIKLYEENLEMIEMGGIDPHFSYNTSEEYREEITAIVEQQKDLIRNKEAVLSGTSWTINGSKTEGKKFINQAVKLASRAFNNEANNIIKNVSWRNFDTSDKKLRKAFDDINKFNESNHISITARYLELKLLELQLTYEQQLKIQEEKENLAEARRLIREEEQLEADALKAQKEEEKYLKLLEKAKKDAANKVGDELDELNEKIRELSLQLEEAHSASERAISMAQQTRAGFVYIISNIGSFGENVYKIGMTRRLEPMDRVKELSGASVPFVFDTHAMIYSEDAPALENRLHNSFSDRRVNLANFRKEYFRVTLNEVISEVKSFGIEHEFFETPEAEEYRKTLALQKAQKDNVEKLEQSEAFPEFI